MSNSGKLFVAGVSRLSIQTYDASVRIVPSLAVVVAGVNASLDSFLAHGRWPGAQGWNHPGGTVTTLADLPRFEATVRAMAQAK
jgi:hypothetical protein